MSAVFAGRRNSRINAPTLLSYDRWLVASVGILILIGIVMVYSASIPTAERYTGSSYYFLLRHLISIAIGLAAGAVILRTRMRFWEQAGPYLLLAGILLLILVMVPGVGVHVNGSSRWLRLGLFKLQPSELVKDFMIVYVAGYLVRKQDELRHFTQGILMVSIVVAVIGALFLQEPDLGAAVVISFTVFLMLFLGGVRFWHFMVVVAAGLGGMILLTIYSPYRMARITGFLHPWADPLNKGFQLTQALIAFGRGGVFGVGLGGSVQKLFYLPAAYTDFLLAVLAEELGLIGVLVTICLFAIVVWRAFVISRAADRLGQVYGARLAQGIGILLGGEAMINMGVNMGALPTKGLTLPFVSYGGSSMVASCIAVALLLVVDSETRQRKAVRA